MAGRAGQAISRSSGLEKLFKMSLRSFFVLTLILKTFPTLRSGRPPPSTWWQSGTQSWAEQSGEQCHQVLWNYEEVSTHFNTTLFQQCELIWNGDGEPAGSKQPYRWAVVGTPCENIYPWACRDSFILVKELVVGWVKVDSLWKSNL